MCFIYTYGIVVYHGQVVPRSLNRSLIYFTQTYKCVCLTSQPFWLTKMLSSCVKLEFTVVRPVKEMIFLYGTVLNITMSVALFSIWLYIQHFPGKRKISCYLQRYSEGFLSPFSKSPLGCYICLPMQEVQNSLWKFMKQSFEEMGEGGELYGAFYLFMSPWQTPFKVQVLGPHGSAAAPALAVPMQCREGRRGWGGKVPEPSLPACLGSAAPRRDWELPGSGGQSCPWARPSPALRPGERARRFCAAFTHLWLQISALLEVFVKEKCLAT